MENRLLPGVSEAALQGRRGRDPCRGEGERSLSGQRDAAMMSDASGGARWRGRPVEAVLFDLDGTLLDTAADIALALNRALAEQGWSPAAQNDVRRMIGRGAPILIQRTATAQGRTLDDASQAAMVERFFHHYGALQETNEFDA